MLLVALAPIVFFSLYTYGLLDELLTRRGEERLTTLADEAQRCYLRGCRAGDTRAAVAQAARALPALQVQAVTTEMIDTAVAVLRLDKVRTVVPREVWDGVAPAGAAVTLPVALPAAVADGPAYEAFRMMLWRAPDGTLLALRRSEREEQQWRRRVLYEALAWSGVLVAGALVLALLLARRFTRPILFLQRWAEAVERGERTTPLRVARRDELGALAATLQRMNARLDGQIADLGELRAYNERLIESMFSGLVTLEADGRVRAVNRRAQELLQLPAPAAAHGRPYRELLAGCPAIAAVMAATLDEGREVQRAEVGELVAGRDVVFGISSNRLRDSMGAVCGAAFFFQDLTDIKRREGKLRQQEQLAALGEMAAAVAHEVRNPLNPIRGFAQLLQQEDDWTEVREYARIIITQVDALRRLVDNLLLYARPGDVAWSDLDVATLIAESLELHQGQVREKRLQVVCAVPPTLPWRGGLAQVRLIADNLIRNAITVLPPGGTLTVTAQREEPWLTLRVADNGPGIAAEHVPQLFTAFFTTRAQGTGLGLAIVRKMAQDMKGEVSVTSTVGQGTEFTVRLPLTLPV